MSNKWVYRILLLGSFLLINLLVLYGLGNLWTYFNSGADRSSMMHTSGDDRAVFTELTWHDNKDVAVAVREEIGRSYLRAEKSRQETLEQKDSRFMQQYFADSIIAQHQRMMQLQGNSDLRVHEMDLNHQLFLEHFSTDGLSAALRDTAYVVYRETYRGEELLLREWDTLNLRVILLKSDRGWKVRHRIALPRKDEEGVKRKISWKVAPSSIRGFNYYPADHPWNLFGDQFDRETLEADFTLLSDMGMNTVRIFVPFLDFGAGSVSSRELWQLQELLDTAKAQNLVVLLTLFDFYGDYSQADYQLTSKHLRQVVQAVHDHPALLAWDIKNEPDLDFESRGKERVLEWLQFIGEYLAKLDRDTPITIGWSDADQALHLESVVDLVSFHYYKDANAFATAAADLRTGTTKPILLGEFGKSSYSGVWNFWNSSETEQAAFNATILEACKAHDLPFLAWTLYDFEKVPERVVGSRPWKKAPQKHFGIIDTKGNQKRSFSVFKK